ncbi:MAG: cytochrome C [Desulfuromonadales bacterium]
MSQPILTSLAVMITLFLAAFPVEATAAFHTGGAGSCNGCHSMHHSEEGLPLSTGSGAWLLRASDASSLCLNCHAGAGGPTSAAVYSFDGSALTPGGDFYWVTKTFSWAGGTSPAARHGHNIIASDFGLTADPNKVNAPGGSYPAAALTCISCHDPHGGRLNGTGAPISVSGSYGEDPAAGTSAGNYRLLGGSDYVTNGFAFTYDAPIARQNPSRPFAESDDSHVDYGAGMSEWCGNCHGAMLPNAHQVGNGTFEHPIGVDARLEADIAANYNSYIRTGDLSGIAATAYLQFVPFERGTTSTALLDPTSTQGPDATANVMCLTCHRAHASAFMYAGRWDFTANLLANSHPAIGDSGATATDVSNSTYGRNIALEFGSSQGSFCQKCHPQGTP